jgi:hypothetical protein
VLLLLGRTVALVCGVNIFAGGAAPYPGKTKHQRLIKNNTSKQQKVFLTYPKT